MTAASNTDIKRFYKNQCVFTAPQNVARETNTQNVIESEVQIQTKVLTECDVEPSCVVVQRTKSSLKDKRLGKKVKGRKKRVRFLDSEEERVPLWQRLGQIFHFLLQCTRNTVETVLRE